MKETHDLLPIGELARRAGFTPSAVRYYDREGLLPSIRSSGMQRRYPRSTLRRLAFIRAAQNIGLSLQEIRDALAALPDSRTPTKSDWTKLSQAWRTRLNEQIDGLTALRDGLDSCIGCGCLSLQRCALSNPDDTAATGGPGARSLPAVLRNRPGSVGAS